MDRHLIDVLFTEGVIDGNTHLKVTQRAAGANMSVDVAIGQAVVDGDDQTDQGSYFVHVTAVENAVIGAPPGSNSRIDLVVLRIKDPNAGGPAGNNAIIDVIQGIAGASPAVPATPASCLPLARVLVTNGDTSVVNAAITDLRVQSQAPELRIGTQAESMTAAARAALTGGDLYDGRVVSESDTGKAFIYDSTSAAWKRIGFANETADAVSATSVTVVNTTTETDLVSAAISSLAAGESLRLIAFGDLLNNVGSSRNIQIRVKIGATTVLDNGTGTSWLGNSAQRRGWMLDVVVTASASNAQRVVGRFVASPSSTPFLIDSTADQRGLGYGTAAEDMSTSKNLKVTAAPATADANLEIVLKGYILQKLKVAS